MSSSREFHYEIKWPPLGNRPGHHESLARGAGFRFREHLPLMRDPDARRVDLNASLRDPFGEIKVRAFRERRAVTVTVIADASASMAYGRKWPTVIEFCSAAAYSAYRTGDSFACLTGAKQLLPELCMVPSRARGNGAVIAERMRGVTPAGSSSEGLLHAAGRLSRNPNLVFLVSDFHWPMPLVRGVLDSLARHAVVPVIIWDPAEFALPQRIGWHEVRDMETGGQRTLWLRPRWHQQLREMIRGRQAELSQVFSAAGARPLALGARFDPDQVTEYFAGGGGWPDAAA